MLRYSLIHISIHWQDLGPEISEGGILRPLPSDLVLGDMRVVLVAPKTEANIGAAARACGNFEVDTSLGRDCSDSLSYDVFEES